MNWNIWMDPIFGDRGVTFGAYRCYDVPNGQDFPSGVGIPMNPVAEVSEDPVN